MSFPKIWAVQQALNEGPPPNEHAVLPDEPGESDDYSFREMLHTDRCRCVGYIAMNGQVVMYGGHYSRLMAEGRIVKSE